MTCIKGFHNEQKSFSVREILVGLHQGYTLCRYLFDLAVDNFASITLQCRHVCSPRHLQLAHHHAVSICFIRYINMKIGT